MILIIDNYDSFVLNIVHFLELKEGEFDVVRNDEVNIDEINEKYDGIIISPGPMTPKEAGCSNEIIKKYYKKIPILGICLGMECIGVIFGGRLKQCKKIMHGKDDLISINKSKLYSGLPSEIRVARYHSLCLDCENLSDSIIINAIQKEENIIMGIEHSDYPLYGVQFHPESILTGPTGKIILRNFMNIIAEWKEGEH